MTITRLALKSLAVYIWCSDSGVSVTRDSLPLQNRSICVGLLLNLSELRFFQYIFISNERTVT